MFKIVWKMLADVYIYIFYNSLFFEDLLFVSVYLTRAHREDWAYVSMLPL